MYYVEICESTLTASQHDLYADGEMETVLTGCLRLAVSCRTAFMELEQSCAAAEASEAAWKVTCASVRRLFSCYRVAVGLGGDGEEACAIQVSMRT